MDRQTEREEASPEASTAVRAAIPELGMGFDSVLGDLRNEAIEFETVDGGSASTFHAKVCSSIEEMGSSLEINQSLSAGFAGFGQVDQKFEFATSQKVTTQSVQVVVYAKNAVKTLSVKNVRMMPSAQKDGLAQFLRVYGDAYIDSVAYGAEFYAVYTFFTQTRSEQTRVASEVEAVVSKGALSASASVQTEFNSYLEKTETSWTVNYDMRGLGATNFPDTSEIIEFARKIPSLPVSDQDRVVLGVTSDGYDHAAGLSLDFTPVRKNRAYFMGDFASDGLGGDLLSLCQRKNSIDWLERIYHTYALQPSEKLRGYTAEVEADRIKVLSQYSEYSYDPLQAFTRPDLSSLSKEPPALTVRQHLGPEWGGNGGNRRDYGNIEEAVVNRRRLDYMRMRAGTNMDLIFLKYGAFPGDVFTVTSHKYGSEDGNMEREMTIQDGDGIQTVSVTHTGELKSLKIETRQGVEIEVGSPGSRTVHTFNLPEGCAFLGFQGRSGERIDKLQVVYAELVEGW